MPRCKIDLHCMCDYFGFQSNIFFLLLSLLNICPLPRLKRFVFVYDWQKNITFETAIKIWYTVLIIAKVNAVEFSLQSGHNTQLRTCNSGYS